MAEPFFWEDRDAWYVNLTKASGKRGRVKLHRTKKKAFEIWKAMDPHLSATDPLVASVADDWIGNLKARVQSSTVSQGHLDNAQSCSLDFLAANGKRRWSDFTRDTVTQYVAGQSWASSTKRKRMSLLRSLSAYGHDEKRLPDNLAKIKKPRETSRNYFATLSDYRSLVEHAMDGNKLRKPFAMFVAGLWLTGARPSELAKAQIKHLEGSSIVLYEHKNSRKTGRPRVIYLDGRGMAVVNASIEGRTDPEAFIFVDSRGAPYNRDSIRNRFSRAREKLGLSDDLVAYSLRHGYAHRALSSGVEVATIAVLMGTSVDLVMKTYGHLHDNQSVLSIAAGRVR